MHNSHRSFWAHSLSISIRWYFLIFHRLNYVFYTTHKHLLIAHCPLANHTKAQYTTWMTCTSTRQVDSSHTSYQLVCLDISFVRSFFLFFFLSLVLFVLLCSDRWSHLDQLSRWTHDSHSRTTFICVRVLIHVCVCVWACEHSERSDARVTEFIIKFWFLDLSNTFELVAVSISSGCQRKPASILNEWLNRFKRYRSLFGTISLVCDASNITLGISIMIIWLQ